jgi:hypothetical protein
MNTMKNSIAVSALETINKASERPGIAAWGGSVLAGTASAVIAPHSDRLPMFIGGAIVGLVSTLICMYPAFEKSNAVQEAREDLENEILKGLVRVQSEKINGRKKWFIYETDNPDNKQIIPVGSNLWTRSQARKLEKLTFANNRQY